MVKVRLGLTTRVKIIRKHTTDSAYGSLQNIINYNRLRGSVTILTKTYYSVIKYASKILRTPTLCVPANSSGIFQVILESVVRAFYTAIRQYVDKYAKTSHTPILLSVCFISNSIDTTSSAAAFFRRTVRHR